MDDENPKETEYSVTNSPPAKLSISDREVYTWLSSSAGFQNSQRHSITTAAYYAWAIPIILLILVILLPSTTRFIQAELGTLQQPSQLVAINEKSLELVVEGVRGRATDDFIIELVLPSGKGRILGIAQKETEYFGRAEFLGTKSRNGFLVTGILVRHLSRGESLEITLRTSDDLAQQPTINLLGSSVALKMEWYSWAWGNNNKYYTFSLLISIILIWKAIFPYVRHWKGARIISFCIGEYVEGSSRKNPIGTSYADVLSELQTFWNKRKNKSHGTDIDDAIAKYSLEYKEAPTRDGTAKQKIILGPFSIAGHPTFAGVLGVRKFKFLILVLDSDGIVLGWDDMTVSRALKPVGQMLNLGSK